MVLNKYKKWPKWSKVDQTNDEQPANIVPIFLASKGFMNSNMIMIQMLYNRRGKKEREREREVDKAGQSSRPFCPIISLHESNVYFGRNSRPINISFGVNDLGHSTDRYHRTNKKCKFLVRTGIRTVDLLNRSRLSCLGYDNLLT
jgi:hypothetical protein